MHRLVSYIMVIIQFSCIGILITTGKVIPSSFLSTFMLLAGIILALWAIIVMRKSHLTIFPNLPKESRFITSGPYRLIRHPMYLSVILVCGSILLNEYSLFRLITLITLIVNFLFKMNFEEKQLLAGFKGYADYSRKTKKLIPFVF